MVDKINLKDIDRFNELGLLVNSNFINLFKLDDLLNSNHDYVYGYYINELLVGFIHISKSFEVVDIVNIVVDKLYRNKGIASKLIDYIISSFDDIDSIMLEVNENNVNAINLYNKNKFKEINRRKDYYGNEDAIIMKRDV